MISVICFIIMLIGSANWFCIGVLQYDFIAGLFGSQANVFSRIIYAFIGIASVWVVISLIKGKGKLKINTKKLFNKKSKENEQVKNPEIIEPANNNVSNQNQPNTYSPNPNAYGQPNQINQPQQIYVQPYYPPNGYIQPTPVPQNNPQNQPQTGFNINSDEQ